MMISPIKRQYLIEIEYLRRETRHALQQGDKICEACLCPTPRLVTGQVVMVDIHLLPWLPYVLPWSQSLQDYIIEHRSEVEMRCCVTCGDYYIWA